MTDCIIIHPNEAAASYGGLADELTAVEPPIWSRIIAHYLRERGVSVQMIDMDALRAPASKLPSLIVGSPKLAVIVCYGNQPSASTQTMSGVPALVEVLNEIDIPSLIVGGHSSALPERTLEETGATYVCDGEGPVTALALLNASRLNATIPGLVYRRFGGIVHNKPAPLLEADKGELEGDAWDLLDMSAYRAHVWQCFGDLSRRKPYASIYSSFGCPEKCSFCCINSPFHSNRYRTRDPNLVVAEIVRLYDKYGVRTIKIADELFILKKRHYEAICRGIIDAGIGQDLNIWCYSRIDTIDEDNLELLRAAGIRWIALGIESASEQVRDQARKALRSNDIPSVVRKIQSAGINVVANLIFGLEGDDHASMESTLALAQELNCDFANFYANMPYPGSKLFADAVSHGLALPETWSGYSQHSYDCTPLANDNLSSAEILKFRDEAFTRYYTSERYLGMISNKFGSDTRAYVEKMAAHKLPRKLLET
jgi:anaerobic magnesium-protoporphyrin IX monomethyl ester cyclase